MKKIPTYYERDWNGNRSRVVDVINPALPENVVMAIQDQVAVPTAKLDGTSCLLDETGQWWARYTRRAGKQAPAAFSSATEMDPDTGKQEGWIPVTDDDPAHKHHRKAIARFEMDNPNREVGTYELVGPKVQGNPHGYLDTILVRHGAIRLEPTPYAFGDWEAYLAALDVYPYEGVVWWLGDEPVAKLKRRDFGLAWPVPTGIAEVPDAVAT